jgi:hypothetical protein
MQNQGQRHHGAGFNSTTLPGRPVNNRYTGPVRPRRMSNDVLRNVKNYQNNMRFNNPPTTGHGLMNPAVRTPVRQHVEPIYINTGSGSFGSASPQTHGIVNLQEIGEVDPDPFRVWYDENAGPPPAGTIRELWKNDPQAYFPLNKLHCTYFYRGAPRKHSGFDSEKSDRTAYVSNVPTGYFTSHQLKDDMADCGTVESIHYMNNGLFPTGSALVT